MTNVNFDPARLEALIHKGAELKKAATALAVGAINLKAMELLDLANTEAYGHPEPTEVTIEGKKGKTILLSLLHLGIKNIRLGPTLPAFVTPAALQILVDTFGIAPIGTVEEDMKALMST